VAGLEPLIIFRYLHLLYKASVVFAIFGAAVKYEPVVVALLHKAELYLVIRPPFDRFFPKPESRHFILKERKNIHVNIMVAIANADEILEPVRGLAAQLQTMQVHPH